jgi:hypothetical protein
MKTDEILSLARTFISGADTSIEAANRLELLLDDSFPDDDYLQETVEMLACYRPEGGSDVIGVEPIRERLIGVSAYLLDQSPV